MLSVGTAGSLWHSNYVLFCETIHFQNPVLKVGETCQPAFHAHALTHMSPYMSGVCALFWIVYRETNVYNDMGMTEVLQCECGL